MNVPLLQLLETVLGNGQPTSHNNIAFHCPFCRHHKPKLEVAIEAPYLYHCWVCDTKGASLQSLFRRLDSPPALTGQLNKLVPYRATIARRPEEQAQTCQLPEYLIDLSLDPDELTQLADHQRRAVEKARTYLFDRGLSRYEILFYDLKYCLKGPMFNRIIVPSYDAMGNLNGWTARWAEEKPPKGKRAYQKQVGVSENVISFESTVDFGQPVVLCEGPFDAIAIRRNAIPLNGKTIPEALDLRLLQDDVQHIYFALDRDAFGACLKHLRYYQQFGKTCYFVELPGKDPGKLGFETMNRLLAGTKPLTLTDELNLRFRYEKPVTRAYPDKYGKRVYEPTPPPNTKLLDELHRLFHE